MVPTQDHVFPPAENAVAPEGQGSGTRYAEQRSHWREARPLLRAWKERASARQPRAEPAPPNLPSASPSPLSPRSAHGSQRREQKTIPAAWAASACDCSPTCGRRVITATAHVKTGGLREPGWCSAGTSQAGAGAWFCPPAKPSMWCIFHAVKALKFNKQLP